MLSLSQAGFAALDPLHTLFASLRTRDQLEMDGRVFVPTQIPVVAAVSPQELGTPGKAADEWFLKAPRISVLFERWVWASPGGLGVPFLDETSYTNYSSAMAVVDGLHEDKGWLLASRSEPGDHDWDLVRARCLVGHGRSPTMAVHVHSVRRFEDYGTDSRLLLQARCRANAIEFSGETVYYVFGTRLNITGVDEATGERVARQYDTGSAAQAPPGVPVGRVHSKGMLTIRSHGGTEPTTLLRGQFDVDLRTPALAVDGIVRTPEAEGWVVWEEWTARGTIARLQPQGTIVVHAEEDSLGVAGKTLNGPPHGAAPPWASVVAFEALVVAAAGIGLLHLLLQRLARGGGLLGLFARLYGHRLLEHPTRQSIHQLVQANPGISIQEIEQRLGVPRSTLRHHLRLLEARGLLLARSHGSQHVLFADARLPASAQRAAAELRKPAIERFLAAVRYQVPCTHAEIAKTLGCSASHSRRMAAKLRSLGVLEILPAGERGRFVLRRKPE